MARTIREAAAPAGAFRPDIQGLRAVAVLAVLLDHLGIPGFAGGFVGVDVFFVISGFLITGQLLRTLDRSAGGRGAHRHALIDFAVRRARRILPASLTVLALTAVAAFLLVSPLRLVGILQDAVATALYVPNLRFALLQTDYLAGTEPSPFQHYWSLGVEEQFYLVWPLLLLGLLALARMPAAARFRGRGPLAAAPTRPPGAPRRTALALGIALVVVASFVACLLVAGRSQPWAFFSLPTRAWELALGGLVAVAAPGLERMPRAAAVAGAWTGAAAVLGSVVLLGPGLPYPGVATLLPVLGAALVIGLGPAAASGGPARLLSLRPAQSVGRISYSLYLVHWPLVVLAAERLSPDGTLPLPAAVVVGAVSVPLAWLLHRFVETPFRAPHRTRAGRPAARRTLLATVGASAALALVFAGGQGAVALRPLDAGRPAPPSLALAPSPAGTPYVPANLAPTLAGATADTGELYTDGCQQSLRGAEAIGCAFGDPDAPFEIVLWGDSHAGRLFPALETVAEQAGVRLQSYTKSGCRSLETVAAWTHTAEPSCAAWRAAVLRELAARPPQLVVFADHLGPQPGRDPIALQADWEAGIAHVLGLLPPASTAVLVSDNPQFPFSAPMCLSAHLEHASACDAQRADALNPPVLAAERAVAERTGARFLDLTDEFCGPERCPPIIGATLVYSDEHHLTATFGAELAGPIGRGLADLLP